MALHRDLSGILDAVTIRSPTSYALRGVVRDVPAAESTPHGQPPVVAALEAEIYAQFYCRAVQTTMPPLDEWAVRQFAHQLSRANCGEGTWEGGWEVVGLGDDGRIAVRKHGLTVYALPEQLKTSNAAVMVGAMGRLRMGKESRSDSPGNYIAFGNADDDGHQNREILPLVRAYFHVTASGAVPLVAGLTRELNRAAVSFRLKTMLDPHAFVRADAAVLYIGRRSYLRVESKLTDLYGQLRRHLRPTVPRFTRALAPGFAIAEDPQTGDSFGQHRCHLVVLGLWRAFQASADRKRDRAAAVVAAFVEAGIDPVHPHLARGSSEDYELLRRARG